MLFSSLYFVLTLITAWANITERAEKKITIFTQNINTRVEKIETVQRELLANMSIKDSLQDDMKKEMNIVRNESIQSKEDIKQYQSMTNSRLDVLENKTSDYDSVNMAKLNKTLTDTRNTVQYYHPEVIMNGSYHSGILTKLNK